MELEEINLDELSRKGLTTSLPGEVSPAIYITSPKVSRTGIKPDKILHDDIAKSVKKEKKKKKSKKEKKRMGKWNFTST